MLISRLSPRYPMANPEGHVFFPSESQSEIDPIFKGRLAAFAIHKGQSIHCTGNGGKREPTDQVRAYINSGGRKNASGVWSGGNGLAAVPGTSLHEKGLALDTADLWLKELEKNESTANQKELAQFGLYKPLTKGNKSTILEDWHIQPIELAGLAPAQRIPFFPKFIDCSIEIFQKLTGLVVDTLYGKKTNEKANELFP